MSARSLYALPFLFACGSSPVTPDGLTLAQEYDAVGVLRVFPDGLEASHLETFSATLDSLRTSGGKAVGQVQGSHGVAVALTGTYDTDTGKLQFDPVTGSVTSTATESVALAGRGEDAEPEDGVADQIVGFVRAEIDLLVREGTFLAVSRYSGRPDPVDAGKLGVTDNLDGTVVVAGGPGCAVPSVGVEIVRFSLDRPEPSFNVVEAAPDGSFTFDTTGISGDVFLVRNAPAGRVSIARAVRVP